MVKLTVLYGPPTDPAAFDAYYFGTHIPLADRLPKLLRNEVSKFGSTVDGSDSPYYLQAELYFDSRRDLLVAFASEEGQATAADVAKFATGTVTMITADVLKEN